MKSVTPQLNVMLILSTINPVNPVADDFNNLMKGTILRMCMGSRIKNNFCAWCMSIDNIDDLNAKVLES
jgi:hypothetical protein